MHLLFKNIIIFNCGSNLDTDAIFLYRESRLMWSHLMLSIAYCDQIARILFSKFYRWLLHNKLVIVIIRLILSVLLGPKAITLSGFHCTNPFLNIFLLVSPIFPPLGTLFLFFLSLTFYQYRAGLETALSLQP